MKIQLHDSDHFRDIAVLRILHSDWLGGFSAKTQQKRIISTHSICNEKSQTCEEGGVQHRISVWHLLMNLENNFLLKNC